MPQLTPAQEPLIDEYLNPASDHALLKYFQEVRKKYLYTSNLGLALDDNDRDATGKPVPLNNLFVPPPIKRPAVETGRHHPHGKRQG